MDSLIGIEIDLKPMKEWSCMLITKKRSKKTYSKILKGC